MTSSARLWAFSFGAVSLLIAAAGAVVFAIRAERHRDGLSVEANGDLGRARSSQPRSSMPAAPPALAPSLLSAGPAEASPPVTFEETRRAWREQQTRWMHSYQREAVDPTFVARVTPKIHEGLALLAGEGLRFSVDAVQCRRHSCLATLSFPSYTDARQALRPLLHATLPVPCARGLFLDPPADPSQPYRTTYQLDCHPAR